MQDPRAHNGSFSLTWKIERRWPVVWTGQLWKNRIGTGNSQREGGAFNAELGQEQTVLGTLATTSSNCSRSLDTKDRSQDH